MDEKCQGVPGGRGKISGLKSETRLEICHRIDQGWSGHAIVEWLNADPDVVEILGGKHPITDLNFSRWKKSRKGYAGWKKARERLERLKELSEYHHELGNAGSGLYDAGSAVAGATLLECAENLTAKDLTRMMSSKPEKVTEIFSAIVSLKNSDIAHQKLKLEQAKEARACEELALEREKFEFSAARKFLKYAQSPEARAILGKDVSDEVKASEIRELLFGPLKKERDV